MAATKWCGYDTRTKNDISDNGCGAATLAGNLQCCGFVWCRPSCLLTHQFTSEHSLTTTGDHHLAITGVRNTGVRVEGRQF